MPPGSGRKGVFPRFGVSEDVERELRAHIEMRAEELVESGWDPAAAHEEAQRLFGDRAAVAEACERITRSHHRAVGRTETMDAIWKDVQYAARMLVRSPGFALVAVVTLALGIGANTAIFSVVNGVLLQPLPFDDPHEVVWVREVNTRGGTMAVAWANFRDWKDQLRSYDGLVAFGSGSGTVLGGTEPVQAQIAMVTQEYWSVFGVVPLQGRLTGPLDHEPSATPVVVVSRRFWQNQLGQADITATVLEVSGARAQVVGVVEDPGFPVGVDVWGPSEQISGSDSRTAHNWSVVGRLAEGVSITQARQETDALTKVLVQDELGADPDFLATGAAVVPLQEQVVGDSRTPLLLLLGAAGLVLLVACTNLASTLLARGATRARELAVRMALGAPRKRMLRQLLTESLVLAAVGGAAGVAVASLVLEALQAVGADSVPRLSEVTIDSWVLGYTGAVALSTAFLFGLVPALKLTQSDAGAALRSGSRGNAIEGRARIWRILIGTEVALALVLLVGTGLLVRSSQMLLAQDTGVDVSDVMTLPMSLSRVKYQAGDDHARWYAEAIETLEALPDVSSAGVIGVLPVSGNLPNGRLELDGDVEKATTAGYVVASGGAFEALDIPLLQGRLFDERDTPDTEHVVIVSRSFAESVWPGMDPIGRQVNGGGMDNFYESRTFARVVGVVGDVRFRDLGDEAIPTAYFPYSQRPFRIQFSASLVVESALGAAGALGPAVRETIRRLDPDVPVRLRTLEEGVRDSLAARRFVMLLFGAFSLLALVLAVVGIYGVVSYSVARRRREMGIRIALGADAGSVRGMVVGSAMRMVAGGLVLGVFVALGVTRLMAGLLYGVSPADPITLAAVVATLAASALFASWMPARASTRIDPMVTMRAE